MYQKAVIQNVVSTASLLENNNSLDLSQLASMIPNARYRPERFSALTVKIKEPIIATALLFANGRIVCVGTKSVKDSETAIIYFVKLISAASTILINMRNFSIQNIVSSFTFSGTLNLPGMCLRLMESRAVIILFTTGKCIITGARSEEEIYLTQNKIYNSISMFLKN
uniref:TATA-box-binding protein n=1 Tax=Meloidogyne incognita TaxID=6306 RepID=A0A914L8X7_MELIC